MFFSCRVIIGNKNAECLNIGTNGKGSSIEYSLASGYAEFMERLQNQMLLKKNKFATTDFLELLPSDSLFIKKIYDNDLVFDFVIDPDEKRCSVDEMIEYCYDELRLLFHTKSKKDLKYIVADILDFDEIVMIPYYSIESKKIKYLPIDLVLIATGSNGMCAGNSSKEALLQGFCEIFERYAVSKIYYGNLTPPTILHTEFIDKPVYEKLQYLKNNSNYEIIIKDCSLGLGLPVIGVIIIDKERQVYNFKLGSDFVIDIALERCLNEIYQGTTEFHGLPFKMYCTGDTIDNMDADKYMFFNFKKIYVNGTGYWPVSIFSDNYSYEYNKFYSSYGSSNEEDFKYCIDIIHNLGYKVFIRDNSYLNFPTYQIIIPGMSQLPGKMQDYGFYNKSMSELYLLRKLHRISKEEAISLVSALEENYHIIKLDNFNLHAYFLYNTNKDLLDLDIELLMFMLFYYIDQPIKANKYLCLFLQDKSTFEYGYFYAIRDYVYYKYEKNIDANIVKNMLANIYGQETSDEVANDLSDANAIFQYHEFPNCFDCENCHVAKDCNYINLLQIEKKCI